MSKSSFLYSNIPPPMTWLRLNTSTTKSSPTFVLVYFLLRILAFCQFRSPFNISEWSDTCEDRSEWSETFFGRFELSETYCAKFDWPQTCCGRFEWSETLVLTQVFEIVVISSQLFSILYDLKSYSKIKRALNNRTNCMTF